jgi:hypothetical protein
MAGWWKRASPFGWSNWRFYGGPDHLSPLGKDDSGMQGTVTLLIKYKVRVASPDSLVPQPTRRVSRSRDIRLRNNMESVFRYNNC